MSRVNTMTFPVNPYIAGNPVGGSDAFIGRKDILSEIEKMLKNPTVNAIVLHGQRRIGKTSILQELDARLSAQKNCCPVFFDLQDKADHTSDDIFHELAQEIAFVLGHDEPELGAHPASFLWETWLPGILESVPDTYLLLLFDELDVITDHKSGKGLNFFSKLRKILEIDRQYLNFVFVIGRDIGYLSINALSLFKDIPTKHISLLSLEDTTQLIKLSENNGTLFWPDEVVTKIWEYTNGHPLLTQHICSRIWEMYQRNQRNNKDDTSDFTASPSDVKEIIPDILEIIGSNLEWLWQGLDASGRIIASVLAKHGPDPISEQHLHELLYKNGVQIIIQKLHESPRLLNEWDLLEGSAEDGYHFRVELIRLWIEKNKSLEKLQDDLNLIEEVAEKQFQAAQGLFQNWKNSGGKNHLFDARHQVNLALNRNPNHVKARLLLSDILLGQDKPEQAKEELEKLFEYQPAVAKAPLIQTLLFLAQHENDGEQQLRLYKQVLDLDTNQPEAIAGYKKIWQRRGETALSKDDLQAALDAYREAKVHDKIFDVEQEIYRRELAKGLQELEQLKTEKNYPKALKLAHGLAKKFTNMRNWAPDIEELDKKAQLPEKYERALGALQNKDRQTAKKYLSQVVSVDPDYKKATTYLHLAVTGVDIDANDKELRKLETENRNLSQLKEKAENRSEQIKKELESLEERIADISADKDKLNIDLTHKQEAEKKTEQELKTLNQKIAAISADKNQLNKGLTNVQVEKKKLQTEINEKNRNNLFILVMLVISLIAVLLSNSYNPEKRPEKKYNNADMSSLWLHLEGPVIQEVLDMPWTYNISIKMALYKKDKQIPANVVTEPDNWLSLILTDKKGKPVSKKPINVISQDGYYIAKISIYHKIIRDQGWLSPGQFHFRIIARQNDLKLEGIWLPGKLNYRRLPGSKPMMTVSGIDIHIPLWALILKALLPLLTVAALVWIGVRYLWPWLTIWKADRDRTVSLLIFDGVRDPGAVAPDQRVYITGLVNIKLDRMIRVPADRDTIVAEYFRVTRIPSPGPPCVKIQYRWHDEDKSKTRIHLLTGRIPKPVEGLSGGNYMITLEY